MGSSNSSPWDIGGLVPPPAISPSRRSRFYFLRPMTGLAWSRMSTGPFTISVSRAGVAVGEEVEPDGVVVVNVDVVVYHDDEFGERHLAGRPRWRA